MVFRASKEKIERCISIAGSIISNKPQMHILTNILLETENDTINVTSSDLEVTIRTSFKASVDKEGSITVNGAKFLGIIKSFPSESDIHFEVTDNNEIKIKSSSSGVKAKYTLRGMPKESYPSAPTTLSDGSSFLLPQFDLKHMIRKTIFSSSQEDSRRYLNGVYFETEGTTMRLVSTDGRRLALIEREQNIDPNIGMQCIVPQKVLNEVSKYLEEDGAVEVSFKENQIYFGFNGIHFLSTLIDGTFPNYNQVIPKTQEKFATIDRKLFVESISRSSLLVEDKYNQLKLDFSENHVVLSINNADVGSFRDELSIQYEGEPIELAFNHKYLRDYFKEVSSEFIVMEMNTPLSAVSVKAQGEDNYIYIVMPMKADK